MQIRIVDSSPELAGPVVYRTSIASTAGGKGRAIGELLERIGALEGLSDMRALFRYRLCLDELIQNAIEHGNDSDATRKVQIELFDSKGEWGVLVRDEGDGFELSEVPDVSGPDALLRENGRGLWILREYMDGVAYFEGGRTAVVSKLKRARAV